MKKAKEFDFTKARRITAEERRAYRQAYENTFGRKMPARGRPPKGADKYQAINIRLHPKALRWAREQARRRGIGYQTVINETLLSRAG